MSEPNEIIRASRQVIEKKLLTALEPGDLGVNQVVVLFTEADLELVALALEHFYDKRADELAEGFRQLQREAFPK